jgi:hypothetical protein
LCVHIEDNVKNVIFIASNKCKGNVVSEGCEVF